MIAHKRGVSVRGGEVGEDAGDVPRIDGGEIAQHDDRQVRGRMDLAVTPETAHDAAVEVGVLPGFDAVPVPRAVVGVDAGLEQFGEGLQLSTMAGAPVSRNRFHLVRSATVEYMPPSAKLTASEMTSSGVWPTSS